MGEVGTGFLDMEIASTTYYLTSRYSTTYCLKEKGEMDDLKDFQSWKIKNDATCIGESWPAVTVNLSIGPD